MTRSVLAVSGGTDQFVVKVEDEGFHLHGLLSLFRPDMGHSTTVSVEVTVDPIVADLTNTDNDTVSVIDV